MATLLQKPISVFKTFLDIVLPPVCYVCGKDCSGKYGLCEACLGKIRHISPPYCETKSSFVEKGWSCCYYAGTIKECVHLFKYKGYIGLADIFRDIMVNFTEKNGIHKEIDLIAPVPIYPTKKRERSYNHAEILARFLSKSFAIPIESKNLKKIKWTQSQSELDKRTRLKNVKDSFVAVDRKAFSGKNVLLVDDVYTTGATINECAKVLLEAKAGRVYSLSLARGA